MNNLIEIKTNTNLSAYSKIYLELRWLLECVIILLLTPVIAPFILLISILIIIDGKNNPFYTQTRIGKNSKKFKLYKFRTINNSIEPFIFCPEQSNRITKFCQFLRNHRIDEIPQLLNVLLGDMTIIGPRPDPVEQFHNLSLKFQNYAQRQIIKPGLTGLAQITVGYSLSHEEFKSKFDKDLEYIHGLSFANDFKIIVNTFSVVLSGFGAK